MSWFDDTIQPELYLSFSIGDFTDEEIASVTVDRSSHSNSMPLLGPPQGGFASIVFQDYQGDFAPSNPTSYYNTILKGTEFVMSIRSSPEESWEPYGKWYTTEWEYNTETAEATLFAVDKVGKLLADTSIKKFIPKEIKSVPLAFWLDDVFAHYGGIRYESIPPYFSGFLASAGSLQETLGRFFPALGRNLVMDNSGELRVLAPTEGLSLLEFTDLEINSYSIKQSTTVPFNGVSLEYSLNTFLEVSSFLTFEDFSFTTAQQSFPITKPWFWSLAWITGDSEISIGQGDLVYGFIEDGNYDTLIVNTTVQAFIKLDVFAYFLQSQKGVINIGGDEPLKVSENLYVQETTQAEELADLYNGYISHPFNTITITIFGHVDAIPGTLIHLVSSKYDINELYQITNIKMSYSGNINTTIVLQIASL